MGAPTNNYNYAIQIWDRDFFASNDLIGEANIDLRPLFEDAIETGRTFGIVKDYYESYLKDIMNLDEPLEF